MMPLSVSPTDKHTCAECACEVSHNALIRELPEYDRVCRAAKRRAGRLHGGRIEWQDLAQEAVLHALKGRKSIDGPMIDLLRHGILGDSRVSPIQKQVDFDFRRLSTVEHNGYLLLPSAQRAIDALTPRDRELIDLLYYREWSHEEIASRFSVNPSRVSQLHSRILRRLRSALTNRPAPAVERAGR